MIFDLILFRLAAVIRRSIRSIIYFLYIKWWSGIDNNKNGTMQNQYFPLEVLFIRIFFNSWILQLDSLYIILKYLHIVLWCHISMKYLFKMTMFTNQKKSLKLEIDAILCKCSLYGNNSIITSNKFSIYMPIATIRKHLSILTNFSLL